VGEAFGFKVDYSHSTNPNYPGGPKVGSKEANGVGGLEVNVPNNGRLLRNLGCASNYLMSHILHFYHLVALDYVDVNGTGLIPKGFLAPNYDSNYYARGIDPVLQTGGATKPAYSVNAYDYGTASWKNTGGTNGPVLGIPGLSWNPSSGAAFQPLLGDLTAYFAGQYVRALKFRRQAHQLGALFLGKMPQASAYTPGCVTTKAYDPTPGGADAAVVQKVHELLYGGPGFDPTVGGNHPFNGQALSMSMPHPESLMGFIGKPSDFWIWASRGFIPGDLPLWSAGTPGVGTALWSGGAGGYMGTTFTGTYMFDTVAAAHVFPEYFWFGSGYGRTLAWGIFEGANPPLAATPDNRLLTRGRTIVPRVPNGSGIPYSYQHLEADHLRAREFTKNSAYTDATGDSAGRHMWKGSTKAVPMNQGNVFPPGVAGKASAYTYAKSPRYDMTGTGNPANFLPHEVGPYARLMSNAVLIGGGPATAGQVVAVDQGQVGLYYPGVLKDVDTVLGAVGVMPGWGANLTGHLAWAQTVIPGSPVFYLPPNAISTAAVTNAFPWDYYGDATLDRIACRALETYYVGAQMLNWFNQLTPGVNSNKTLHYDWGEGKGWKEYVPTSGQGAGLTEAPRGALGHWVVIGKKKTHPNYKKLRGKVSNYQIITPTTWNINPKDHLGNRGPAEECVVDTPLVNIAEPIEVLRVYHSFDFCCACTVHVLNPKKEEVAKVTLEALP
jgi:Ni,Fe-hydrogenase I large subunit